jgi:glycerophosphoryl diester phosphodiesterase
MRSTPQSDFFAPPHPRVIAHRGDSGAFPENTIESFQAGVAAGAPYIELDVHMTRDGEVVVAHDEHLQRMCGATSSAIIAQLSREELAGFDAGFNFTAGDLRYPFRGKGIRIPRLRDVLGALPGQRFVVEVKQIEPSLVRAMLDVIDRAAMRRRVMVVSEHQEPLDEIRRMAPGIPTNFSRHEVAALFQAVAKHDTGYRPPAEALQVPPQYGSWKLVTPEIVEAAHRAGVEVHVWTVNDPIEMRQMLDLGVDGIITDFPKRLIDVLSAALV